MPDGPQPVDWQGEPIECEHCVFQSRLDAGQCGQAWACVHDRYAKRVERFFLLNPDLADECLSMPYFEVRMNAARVATLFRLPPLLNDEDAGVRAMAVLRLPVSHARRMAKDPDRRVRIAVAHRLPVEDLLPVFSDTDNYVRSIAARRSEPGMLVVALSDDDPEIRRIVARRINDDWLNRFLNDPDPLVRREAAQRRPDLFAKDPDLRVRHTAAERGSFDVAEALIADDEEVIREAAEARLAELKGEATHVD
ncbi:MAG: 4Fe4S-binding leucine-rich repeat protein [Pseudomonadota bacterium]